MVFAVTSNYRLGRSDFPIIYDAHAQTDNKIGNPPANCDDGGTKNSDPDAGGRGAALQSQTNHNHIGIDTIFIMHIFRHFYFVFLLPTH